MEHTAWILFETDGYDSCIHLGVALTKEDADQWKELPSVHEKYRVTEEILSRSFPLTHLSAGDIITEL